VLWSVLCRAAIVQLYLYRRLLLYCIGPVLFMFSGGFISVAALSPKKAPGEFLLSRISRLPKDTAFIVDNDFAGAVCWFGKRDDVFITGGRGEYAYGLGYEEAQDRELDVGQIRDLILRQGRTEPVVLVLEAKYYAQCEAQFPSPCREERRKGIVWAEY